MAQQQQQQTTTTESTATTGPLTPQELREQNRLTNVINAITRNPQQGEMKINGVVYTPRWSNPVWVQPNSLSVLFVYCLPGEYADSGQQILGSRDLNVLESYSIALSPVITGWLIVVENQHQTERSPASVGVVCASDANDPETRVLSPQEQIMIKNVIQQFIMIRNIQKTNITQIINIINNITSNQTGGGGNNQTGNQTGGATALRASIGLDVQDGIEAPALYELIGDVQGGTLPYNIHWDFGDGEETTLNEVPTGDVYHTFHDPGNYTIILTATDATGQTASDESSLSVPAPSTTTHGGENATTSTTEEEEQPPTTNETAAAEVTPPATTEGEGTTTTPSAATEGETTTSSTATGGGAAAEQPPATEGADATTTSPLDTLGQ
ncbi:MAG: PKD domain-containing protein [Nitrososphaera sp.]